MERRRGDLPAAWRRFERLDAGEKDAPELIRGAGNKNDATEIGGSATSIGEPGGGHAGPAHTLTFPAQTGTLTQPAQNSSLAVNPE